MSRPSRVKQISGSGVVFTIRQPEAISASLSKFAMRVWCSIIAACPDSPCCARLRKSLSPINRRDHCTDVVYGSKAGPVAFPGMYEACARKAWATLSGWRQKNIPLPMGTENHLCASHVIESAVSIPER